MSQELMDCELRFIQSIVHRTDDFDSLRNANRVFSDYLSREYELPDDTVLVTDRNSQEIISELKSKGLCNTLIVVSANYSPYDKIFRYVKHKENGEEYSVYYENDDLPSIYGPRVDIISQNSSKIRSIYNDLIEFCNRDHQLTLYYDSAQQDYGFLPTKVFKGEEPVLYQDLLMKSKVEYASIHLQKIPWVLRINEGEKISYKPRNTYRELQKAMFYSSIERNYQVKKELKSYQYFFERPTGFLAGLSVPADSPAMKQLKSCIFGGRPFTSDMVDQAFPTISLFYRGLPNDLYNRFLYVGVENRVKQALDDISKKRRKICARYGISLDNEWGECHRELKEVLTELDKDYEKTVSQIINTMHEWDQFQKERAAEEREERRAEREYSDSGSSGSLLGAAVGAAVGAHAAKRKQHMDEYAEKIAKKHLMGTSVCVLGKHLPPSSGFSSSYTASCVNCPYSVKSNCADKRY